MMIQSYWADLLDIYGFLGFQTSGTHIGKHAMVNIGSPPVQMSDGQYSAVAAHELGHTLKLPHGDGIMMIGDNPDIKDVNFDKGGARKLRLAAEPCIDQ